jgi:hypothetical protein
MATELPTEERRIQLSKERAEHLRRLAQRHQVSEDQVVASALDILFGLTDVFDGPAERQGWSFLSKHSLTRVWDNEEDAAYDNWRELYGVPAR